MVESEVMAAQLDTLVTHGRKLLLLTVRKPHGFWIMARILSTTASKGTSRLTHNSIDTVMLTRLLKNEIENRVRERSRLKNLCLQKILL